MTEQEAWIPATPTGFHRNTPPRIVHPNAGYVLAWDATAHASSYQLQGGATQTEITGREGWSL